MSLDNISSAADSTSGGMDDQASADNGESSPAVEADKIEPDSSTGEPAAGDNAESRPGSSHHKKRKSKWIMQHNTADGQDELSDPLDGAGAVATEGNSQDTIADVQGAPPSAPLPPKKKLVTRTVSCVDDPGQPGWDEAVSTTTSSTVQAQGDHDSRPLASDALPKIQLPKKKQILSDLQLTENQPAADPCLTPSPSATPLSAGRNILSPSPQSADSGFKLKSRWLTKMDDAGQDGNATLSALTTPLSIQSPMDTSFESTVSEEKDAPGFDPSVNVDDKSTWPLLPRFLCIMESEFQTERYIIS